jgi:hypothetical protein
VCRDPSDRRIGPALLTEHIFSRKSQYTHLVVFLVSVNCFDVLLKSLERLEDSATVLPFTSHRDHPSGEILEYAIGTAI